jgi:hypothetical protein
LVTVNNLSWNDGVFWSFRLEYEVFCNRHSCWSFKPFGAKTIWSTIL